MVSRPKEMREMRESWPPPWLWGTQAGSSTAPPGGPDSRKSSQAGGTAAFPRSQKMNLFGARKSFIQQNLQSQPVFSAGPGYVLMGPSQGPDRSP